MELAEDEEMVFNNNANLSKGIEQVGGKIKITDKRVFFHPHAINFHKEDIVIPISDIEDVYEADTFAFFPNGVEFKLNDGNTYRFAIGFLPYIHKKIIRYIRGRLA